MMHRAWSSIVEVPYCFSRSYVKFQGHTALKIVEFDPNWAFPDCNSSLNSPMAMKCCTKLETAKERCPIVFQGHPSNFKVTRDKASPILTQIGRFRTIGRSQLSNPSDLPCFVTIFTSRASYGVFKVGSESKYFRGWPSTQPNRAAHNPAAHHRAAARWCAAKLCAVRAGRVDHPYGDAHNPPANHRTAGAWCAGGLCLGRFGCVEGHPWFSCPLMITWLLSLLEPLVMHWVTSIWTLDENTHRCSTSNTVEARTMSHIMIMGCSKLLIP